MRNYSTRFLILLLVIFIFFFILKLIKKMESIKSEKIDLINQSIKLSNCIDIQNNNKRKIYENIKLKEYCINKFGFNK